MEFSTWLTILIFVAAWCATKWYKTWWVWPLAIGLFVLGLLFGHTVGAIGGFLIGLIILPIYRFAGWKKERAVRAEYENDRRGRTNPTSPPPRNAA